jgi:hypothetical protein
VYTQWSGRETVCVVLNDVLVMISNWLVVFAESVVRWKWSFTLREFQIGIVMLYGIKIIVMLIKGVAFVFVLVDTQL